jgi:DNA topoisomerase-1
VTLAEALELLSQPKAARRGFGAAREPLKTFDESPVTKQKIQLFDGRYGLYLTDGETNASLPKGVTPEELTQASILQLLADRAALGPSKKSRRKAAKRPATAKASKKPVKAAKKKPAAKKSAKKKSAAPKRKPAGNESP